MKKAFVWVSLSLILALNFVCIQEYSVEGVDGSAWIEEQNIPFGGEADDDVIEWLYNNRICHKW